MTEPVTSLDARALVSEIRQLLEKITPGEWEAEAEEHDGLHVLRFGSALESRGNYESHHLIEYQHDVYPEDGDGAQYAEADANARFIAAAPRLLTAVLGLIEQQQEEIRKLRRRTMVALCSPCTRLVEAMEDAEIVGTIRYNRETEQIEYKPEAGARPVSTEGDTPT
jgi:hypothetical protein